VPDAAISQGQLLSRNRVVAAAAIEAVATADGATRLPVRASQAPLVPWRTPDAVYPVGEAARPLEVTRTR